MAMTPARLATFFGLIALFGCASVQRAPRAPIAPAVDYHQHLVSPNFARVVNFPPFDAAALIRRLDAAGVGRAVVLSTAYSMADERKGLPDPDRLVRDENNWTSGQVTASHGRLVGFCGVNPLRDTALDEIRRCLALPGMHGLKLHFGNSGISLRNPAHLARMVEVFSLLARLKAPVLVHMRARGGVDFGAPDAQIFLEKLLPMMSRSDVIVAHFGGAGPGYPDQADDVMAVFAAAAEQHDPRMRRVYFDVATILTKDSTAADARLIAKRIRQLGAQHVLYGSDLGAPSSPTITEAWSYIVNKLGLTAVELRTIANNRLSFVR